MCSYLDIMISCSCTISWTVENFVALLANLFLLIREIILVVRLMGTRLGIGTGLPLRDPPGRIIVVVIVTPGVQSGLGLNC